MSTVLINWRHTSGRNLLAASVFCALPTAAAFAGGYDTGERDWDFLFQARAGGIETATRYIAPQRTLKNVTNTLIPGQSPSVRETEAFLVTRASATVSFNDQVSCMASFRQPFEGHADYGTLWAGSAAVIEQHFSSRDLGLTCAYSHALDMGLLHILGGASHQTAEYELTSNAGLAGIRRTLVNGENWAWRAGIGYEIPQYALRATLIYNSDVTYNMQGTLNLSNIPGSTSIAGSITLPQSLELKLQSGVAPGWLLFGSARWTNWSVADTMLLCPTGVPVCSPATSVSGLVLGWKDTWTLTAGAAHQVSEKLTVTGSLTWDQGASQGFTSQTDTWLLNLNSIYNANEKLSFRLGASVGIMTAGNLSTATLPGGIPNPVGYTASFGNDKIYAVDASLTYRF